MSTVELPTLSWGSPSAERVALLVHGLGSDAHTMWRIGEHLASEGWLAVAVDQRGHGSAPRTTRYRIEDYARDLLAVPHDRAWDVAIGHSIGGANLVAASALEPGFAARLALIDPSLKTSDEHREQIRATQLANHVGLTIEQQRETNPHWHSQDIESSVNAVRAASEFALEHSVLDNDDWDVMANAKAVTVPTLVFQADPTVFARYLDEHAVEIEAVNPLVSRTVIAGTGHSLHRDAPDEFCRRLSTWLNT
jgi:pimeloyl-ACP methyl ester carboxylesterase